MAEEVKGTETQQGAGADVTQQNNNTQTQQNNSTETKVDVERVKKEALSGFLKELGVDDAEALKGIVTKQRKADEANKTELQKKDDILTATTKELATEREARIIAEAKLSAIQLGAKPELVEDLVLVAKAKITKDKDINAVIAEIKDGTSGKIYFAEADEEEDEGSKSETKGKTVTRARVTKPSEKSGKEKQTKTTEEETNEKHTGSMAERLLAGRKKNKSHYFS